MRHHRITTGCVNYSNFVAFALLEQMKPSSRSFSSLADSFGRRHNYLRISLTERCNLRCSYCMPKEGIVLTPEPNHLTLPDFERLSSLFVKDLGITKIRLTGGEPTLSKHFMGLVQHLGALKRDKAGLEDLCVTTNAVKLGQRPKIIDSLIASGVNRFNLSLDSLIAAKFSFITRRPETHFHPVKKALDHLLAKVSSREHPDLVVKLNVVVQKGFNDDELLDFTELTRESDLQVRFIEFMPFSSNKWSSKMIVSKKEMLTSIQNQLDLEKVTSGKLTAEVWKPQGFKGSIGFISSMSDHFCSTCSRLRLLHDGKLKTCLFSAQDEELDLKKMIAEKSTDPDLASAIHAQVFLKKFKLGGFDTPEDIRKSGTNRPMISIGG